VSAQPVPETEQNLDIKPNRTFAPLTRSEWNRLITASYGDVGRIRETHIDLAVRAIVDETCQSSNAGVNLLLKIGKRAETRLSDAIQYKSVPIGSQRWFLVVNLLVKLRSRCVIEPLRTLLQHETPEIRREAVACIVRAWPSDWAEIAKTAFADADRQVKSAALFAIDSHIRDVGLNAEECNAYFEIVTPIVAAQPPVGELSMSVVQRMMQVDRSRAIGIVLSPRVLRLDHPQLEDLLFELGRAKVNVPIPFLNSIIEAAQASAPQPALKAGFGRAIVCLARQAHEVAKPWIERSKAALENPQEAVEPIVIAYHLPDAILEAGGLEQDWYNGNVRNGMVEHPREKWLLGAILECQGCVVPDGFREYFESSSGLEWSDAAAGLEMIGDKESADLIRRAAAVFRTPLSENADERAKQVNTLAEEDLKLHDRIWCLYYKRSERINVLAASYLVEHREWFPPRFP
jgi:hypothetical protein